MNDSSIFCNDSANLTSGESFNLQHHTIIFTINIVFSLPANVYVIWLIVKQRLQNEIFFFNLALTEIIFCLSSVYIVQTFQVSCLKVQKAAVFFGAFLQEGRPLFQCCICMERYVAVVHPIIFLKNNPLKYRALCTAFVWILTISFSSVVTHLYDLGLDFLVYHLLLAQYAVIFPLKLFSCLMVLKVLYQTGPREVKRNRKMIQKSKIKAFRIIFMVLIFSLLNYVPIVSALVLFNILDFEKFVVAWSSCLFFVIMAGTLHPLIFVSKSASLPSCKRS